MKRGKRILLAIGCIMLLGLSWLAAVTAKTDAQRQEELMAQAAAYVEDEIYIRAVPLLEEAAAYEDAHTLEAEEALKNVYLHLIEKSGYPQKYTGLLEKQMNRKDAAPQVFQEAAEYYLAKGQTGAAITILRTGAELTGSPELTELYEANRYVYELGRDFYQEVTAIYNGSAQVKQEGYWGLADRRGSLVIPCEYDWISTYSGDRAIVQKDGVISAVDADNNRVALFHGSASEFTNFGENRLALHTPEGWLVAGGELHTGRMPLEEIGMYSNGCAAAKLDGKWGLLSPDGTEWTLAPQYDGIIQDELGRSFDQEAVFVRSGNQVLLLVKGEQTGGIYEDAQPFNGGWAAVKQNGKWGFIDTEGTVQIDFQFQNALSFSGHLAAVETEDGWGYIDLHGKLVISPKFLEAKRFYKGSAPVKTADGWRFLTLTEYEEGAGGLL